MKETKNILKYNFTCMQTLKQWNSINLLLILITFSIALVTLLNVNALTDKITKQNTEILKLLKGNDNLKLNMTYIKDIPNITLTKEHQDLLNN